VSIQRVVAVSDLHLGAAGRGADAFTSFLSNLPRTPHESRLLLLGDMFELLSPAGPATEARARIRLDQLAARYPDLFTAMRGCLRRGWSLDVVPGNHDMAIALPSVHRHLAALVAQGNPLRVHPWLYYLPGMVYAEHGHQHHDLNRFPTVLDPFDPRHPDRLFVPPLGRWHGRPTPAVLMAAARSRSLETAAGQDPYRGTLRTYAKSLGLPPYLVLALHDTSSFRVSGTAERLARRGATSLVRRVHDSTDGYLVEAAKRVHAALVAAGFAVPVYLFGHTHRARVVPLDPNARYINTGTWADGLHFPYAELVPGAEPTLRYWAR
jgi:UDP-2,3-diacylglucosamine pyrophosphatase LpxH